MHVNTLRSLGEFILRKRIKVVGFDLRGTLIDAARSQNLLHILELWRISDPVLRQTVDEIIPQRVKDVYRARTEVGDWTLVTLAELWQHVAGCGWSVDSASFESAFRDLRQQYIEDTRPLIGDGQLRIILRVLANQGVKSILLCDGDNVVQTGVFRTHFPDSSHFLEEIYTSSSIGLNKLSPGFYANVCARLKISPETLLVVGDRLDKDVIPAQLAGCTSLLIAMHGRSDIDTISSIAALSPHDADPLGLVDCGAIVGRFQPFHLDHAHFLHNALARCNSLYVCVSNPFPSLTDEPASEDGHRTVAESNPLPFWLRREIIKAAVSQCTNRQSIAIIPFPLHRALRADQMLPPNTTVFTTAVESWAAEKEKVLQQMGFSPVRLYTRTKNISGSDIRHRIRERQPWEHLVPEIIARRFGAEIVKHVLQR